jgi:hypothetical protein
MYESIDSCWRELQAEVGGIAPSQSCESVENQVVNHKNDDLDISMAQDATESSSLKSV